MVGQFSVEGHSRKPLKFLPLNTCEREVGARNQDVEAGRGRPLLHCAPFPPPPKKTESSPAPRSLGLGRSVRRSVRLVYKSASGESSALQKAAARRAAVIGK